MTQGRPGRRAFFLIKKELGFSREEFKALSWVDQTMYIEEMIIDDYLKRLNQFEDMSEDEQWEQGGPPPMPTIVEYYNDIGELFLDSDEDNEDIAPDILSFPPDVFG